MIVEEIRKIDGKKWRILNELEDKEDVLDVHNFIREVSREPFEELSIKQRVSKLEKTIIELEKKVKEK